MYLYKPQDQIVVSVDIKQTDKVELTFSSDCGKFGTDELLATFKLTPERLLDILNMFEGYTDEELE